MEEPKLVMIVRQGTIVQEVLTDKIVEQDTIVQVQVEHNVKQDTHVQEALDQIVVSLPFTYIFILI